MRHLRLQHAIVVLVAAACVGLAMADGGFGATAFSATALILWVAVVAGLATGILPRSEPPASAIATGLCLAGLAGLMALSMAWGNDDGGAFEDVVRTLAYTGMFAIVVLGSRPGEARFWLAGLAAGLAIVGAIALLARFEPSLFGNPDAEIVARLPAAVGRLTYPVGYWNGLAAAMAAAIALLGWLGAGAGSRAARALCALAMPVPILALWATDSRGGIVATLFAFIVLVGFGPSRSRLVGSLLVAVGGGAVLVLLGHWQSEVLDHPGTPLALAQGDRMLVFTIVVMAATGLARYALDARIQGLAISRTASRVAIGVAALATVAVVIASDPVQRIDEFKQPPQATDTANGNVSLLRSGGSGRYQFWTAALDAFEGAPAGGVGSSGYTPYWFEHRDVPISATRAHSLLFETLAELGLAGFALVVGFFAVAAVSGIRRARSPGMVAEASPALALLLIGFLAASVDWTWDLPAVFLPTVVAAGLLAGPATGAVVRVPAHPPGTVARSRRRFAAGVAVLLVAWVSICASGLLLLADHALQSSRDAAARGDIQGATDAANDAIKLEPWGAAPRIQLALVYERGGDYAAAGEAIGEAIDRAPDNFQLYEIAARIDAEANDFASARANLARALRLNPLDPELLKQAARIS